MSDGHVCVPAKAAHVKEEEFSHEASLDQPWQEEESKAAAQEAGQPWVHVDKQSINGIESTKQCLDDEKGPLLAAGEATSQPSSEGFTEAPGELSELNKLSELSEPGKASRKGLTDPVATEEARDDSEGVCAVVQEEAASAPMKRACPDEIRESEEEASGMVCVVDGLGKGQAAAMTKEQYKYASSILRQLRKNRDARPFNQPVDPIKLNIPTYPTIITNPMDLGTIDKKLSSKQYSTVEAFTKDVYLVFTNCFTFNGSESPISTMAKNLQAIFDKQMQQMPSADYVPVPKAPKIRKKSLVSDTALATNTTHRTSAITDRPRREIHPPPPRDLPYNEAKPHRRKNAAQLQFCRNVIKELQKKTHESYAFPFYHPVDPVALNIPDYYKIVKHPMDMSTIQGKLNNVYSTADEFESDIRQMFRNCYKFNPVGTPVYNMGKRLEAVFDKKWQERPTDHHTYSSDDSDTGSDDVDENEGIALLEKQLAMMSDQLNAMRNKRASLKTKKSGKLKKSMSKKSGYRNEDEHLRILSFDQRSELAQKINLLTGSKLDTVLRIMKESMPELEDQTDEIELDIDSMTPRTQNRLWNFVILNQLPNTPIGPAKAKPIAPKKSRTVLSEAEQLRQIRQLERQLSRFENKGNGNKYVSSHSGSDDSSSATESSSAED